MKAGRPLKYREYLRQLDNNSLYCPSTIVAAGQGRLMSEVAVNDRARLRQRIRHTLNCLARSRHFPERGDGQVKSGPKQRYCPAWHGSRWKAILDENK